MGGKNGSIMLFFSQLPPNLTRRDLRSFVLATLRSAGVRGNPLLSLCPNCSILRITDSMRGTTVHGGLVEIQPAQAAMQAIEILDGKPLNGMPLKVRRYRNRSSWTGAYRDADVPEAANPLQHERRATSLKIDLVESTGG